MTKKRILLIDNDEDTLFLVSRALTHHGYVVESCNGGCSVVGLEHSVPDLFILDKDMPTIDGIAVCKFLRLRSETKNTPIIVISGYPVCEAARNAGANAFLSKPFDVCDLLKTVDRYCGYPATESAEIG